MVATTTVRNQRSSSFFSAALARDLGEMAIVLLLYLGLVARLIAPDGEHWKLANLLLLPSEGLVVIFLLFRRRTEQISMRWQEWLLALSATVAPMLVQPGVGAALVWPMWGASLLLMGMIIQVHAKLTLGRSFGCVPANRGLKLAGPYRFVRHPMYAGYLLSHVAFLLMNPTVWNVVLYTGCYALQIPRLLNEERLLAHDPQYRAYQATVKYRLIPGIF
ncbi:MAG: isoprenylcysteine carboxylmethyltransferase family protein [Rhodopirellula sp.]|nr:isoprenylcysteine carboxylmethyltransferase family protein [Rhodopirellula sp.]